MLKANAKSKSGFTIIEVVLVLAIAGLIFLMVFIALPALQRSQKDTQRKDDVSRLQTALQNYKSNNRGQLPTGTGLIEKSDDNAWGSFYKKYLLAQNGGEGDVFADPGGDDYKLNVQPCGTGGTSLATGTECNNSDAKPYETWAEQATNYDIKIIQGAKCEGEKVVAAGGSRKVALAYKLEGGGVVCIDN